MHQLLLGHLYLEPFAQRHVQHRVVIMRSVWWRRIEGLVPQGQSVSIRGVQVTERSSDWPKGILRR